MQSAVGHQKNLAEIDHLNHQFASMENLNQIQWWTAHDMPHLKETRGSVPHCLVH